MTWVQAYLSCYRFHLTGKPALDDSLYVSIHVILRCLYCIKWFWGTVSIKACLSAFQREKKVKLTGTGALILPVHGYITSNWDVSWVSLATDIANTCVGVCQVVNSHWNDRELASSFEFLLETFREHLFWLPLQAPNHFSVWGVCVALCFSTKTNEHLRLQFINISRLWKFNIFPLWKERECSNSATMMPGFSINKVLGSNTWTIQGLKY